MRSPFQISASRRIIIVWYGLVLVVCFGLCYILATPYDIINWCDGSIRFFVNSTCDKGISAIIVKMNSATLNPMVASHLPPLSYTSEVGWHLLGTDALGRDVFAGLLYGGQRSLFIGFVSAGLSIALGWFLGLGSVYVQWHSGKFPFFWFIVLLLVLLTLATREFSILFFVAGLVVFKFWMREKRTKPRPTTAAWWWGRGIEWYQSLPDLLLLLVLSAALGKMKIHGLIVIIIVIVWPSIALVARRMAYEISRQNYFTQAIRNKINGLDLLIHYLWGNTRSTFWALFPLVVARVILLESTISFLGMGLPPDVVTLGSMISSARYHLSSWWLIVFPCLFIFILVFPLILLGREFSGRKQLKWTK